MIKWLQQDSSKGLCPMCRQVFSYKKGMIDELRLQRLIDGHQLMRQRMEEASEDFERFE